MARGSRRKSHRSNKHRDRSDSEEDADSRERRPRKEAEVEARVSEREKPKSSSGKDLVGNSNGEFSGENGKKRKDRGEDSVVSDRWNGGDRESKKERSEAIDTERSKASSGDPKGKSSSRRLEGSSERNEEKRRSEKESSRRESSSSRYKEKERERERGTEKDKKGHDSRNGRYEDVGSRKEERAVKENVEVISELQEEMDNSELEKQREKRMKRRRDGSGDNDNLQGDGKRSDAKRSSSKDDHSRNGSYKEERYNDVKCSERYGDDIDRDRRKRNDKIRDEHASKTYARDRSDLKHSRDENRVSESHYKTKLQESDHDGSPHVDDRGTKLKDNRGRKRSSDKIEDSTDVTAQTAKESQEDTEKNGEDTERKGSRSGKLESHTDRDRESSHLDKVDYGHSNNRLKSSPGSSVYAVKNQTRQTESSRRDQLSEETCHPSREEHRAASTGRQRVPESRPAEKTKLKDDIRSDTLLSEAAGASHYDESLRSDIRGSPNQLTEKSSTSTGDLRLERIGARRILDVEEVGQRSNSYQDGRNSSASKNSCKDEEFPVDEQNASGNSQDGFLHSEPTSLGPSSYHQTVLKGSSPGHLLPSPPVRLAVGSPSGLGPYEDENRIQRVDHKTNNLYKKSSDVGAGRGGTSWKSFHTMSPAANGFMPLQHGHPAGFHSAVQQFPAPPLFGVRPMDLNHVGVSYHPPEANMFSGYSRPYGWHDSMDVCPSQLQLWDGSNNIFGDESHMYGRPDWNQNWHLMGNRAWEINVDMWNRQNGNVNMEPLIRKEQEYSTQALADESWAGKSGHHSRVEQAVTDITANASAMIQSSAASIKNALGTPAKSSLENISKPPKMPRSQGTSEKQCNSYAPFCYNYLSKLYISPDLVQPELHEQCMSSSGMVDGIMSGNVFTQEHHKEARTVAKSKRYFLRSRPPSAIDAFQRAMSLYTKQKAEVKEAMNPELHLASTNKEKVPTASDGTKANADSPNSMEEDLPLVGATAFPMEVEKKQTTEGEGDLPEDEDHPSNTEEQKRDNILEAVVSAEGSEVCEALMPGCMVNLSRIHHSPRSTH